MIKILHIIPVWSLSTGPSQILLHLLNSEETSQNQHSIAVFNKKGIIPDELKKYRVYAFPTFLIHRWKWSPRFKFFLETHYPYFDILHLHGCWIYPNYLVYKLSKKHSIPYILRPAGALLIQAMKSNHKWLKKVYFHFVEKKIIIQASTIHALSPLEKNALKKTFPNQPIVVSPPNIPKPSGSLLEIDSLLPREIQKKKILITIGSLSPIKNLEFLSTVLQKVKLTNSNFCWVIAGPCNTPFGKKLKRKISKALSNHVWFAGEVNNSEKFTLLNAAYIYLSASKSENFGLSILEAIRSNTIVVAGENQPWTNEIKMNFGYSIPLSLTKFSNTIEFILQSSPAKPINHLLQVPPYTWENMYKDILKI